MDDNVDEEIVAVDEPSEGQINWPIVGIGSSAGGLEALTATVKGLEIGTDCTFVIIQHLSPHYRSMLVQLLGRNTTIAVQEIQNGERPKRDVIYVAPANHNVVLKENRFQLLAPPHRTVPKPSVDIFFRTIAEELGELAVGIILSGTGSDGAQGVKAVKAAGGSVIVQDPDDAKYDGMPRAAIETGATDLVIPADQIAKHIQSIAELAGVAGDDAGTANLEEGSMATLLGLVKKHAGIDFRGYKQTTLQRRIQRRMAVTRQPAIAEYVEHVEQNPKEVDSLIREVLVSVTSFFRDHDAFKAVGKAIEAIIEDKENGDEVRIWVPGCATGEEAYSLGMLALDRAAAANKMLKVLVFATDIDNNALTVARRGVYPSTSMAEIPQNLATTYFIESPAECEVSKNLRDAVIFARQDLVLDPPFMNMDLISCRNVLIYFTPELQSKILSILYHALKSTGYLFLGRSESVSQQQEMFVPSVGKWRIFQPSGGRHRNLAAAVTRDQTVISAAASGSLRQRRLESIFFDAMMTHYAPAALMINARQEILHSAGNLENILSFPEGQPKLSLSRLICEEFRTDVSVLIHAAHTKQKSARGRAKKLKARKSRKPMRMVVHPITLSLTDELFLVCFEVVNSSAKSAKPVKEEITTLAPLPEEIEDELAATREHLQVLNEELETSNEEMQALTEELQASNEELQATNEELEASNEELQATNEELVTLNQEMIQKSGELAALNADFENVHNSMAFPIIVLDNNLSIKRLNQAASQYLNVPYTIRGQRLSGMSLPSPFDQLTTVAAQVTAEGVQKTLQVNVRGLVFDLEASPCLSAEGETTGVIMSLIDNSNLHDAEREAREARTRLTDVMNNSNFVFAVKDIQGRYVFANARFEELFGVTFDEINGKRDADFLATDMMEKFRNADLEVLQKQALIRRDEMLEFDAAVRHFNVARFPIMDNNGSVHSICLQAEEITGRKLAEDQVRLAARVFEQAGEGIMVTTPERDIVTVNQAFCRMTGFDASDLVGKPETILRSDYHDDSFYAGIHDSLASSGTWQGEVWTRRNGSDARPDKVTITAVYDDDRSLSNYVTIISDVSHMKQNGQALEHFATHDELTDLPNRRLFMDRLKHAIARMERQGSSLVVFYLDFDDFRALLDHVGGPVGDTLLQQATARLKECLRPDDTLSRLDRDRFAILMEGMDFAGASPVAARIVDYLSASFRIDSKDIHTTVSLGASVYPSDSLDSETLVQNAETAMQRAREQGRNQYACFSAELKAVAQQRLALEASLQAAVVRKDFTIAWQPMVRLSDREVVGVEALIRWTLEETGPVAPDRFVPVAARTGLLDQLSLWRGETVLAQMAKWQKAGLKVPPVTLNMASESCANATLLHKLPEMCASQGISPESLYLDVTEEMLAREPAESRTVLASLHEAGFQVALDDFGSGPIALGDLAEMPLTLLKIDSAFVQNLGRDPRAEAMVKSMLGFAQALGLSVVAEGVETEQQHTILSSLGCDYGQGFFYGRPMDAHDLENTLRAG